MDDRHDLGLYAMIYDFSSITTNDLHNSNDSQMVDADIGQGIHGMANGFHPTIGDYTPYFTPFPANTTTTTITTRHVDNSQRADTSIDPFHGMVNGFEPNNIINSPSNYVGTMPPINNVETRPTPVTIPTTSNNNNPAAILHHVQVDNSYPMNIDNINDILKNTNYPLNLPITQNPPLTSDIILSNPSSTQKQTLVPQFPLDFTSNMLSSSKSEQSSRMKEFRVYKMPSMGLNTDVWSWEEYGKKNTDDDSTRTYYRCGSRDDCMAKRRVENKRSDPDSFYVKYWNNHNHPIPSLMTHSAAAPVKEDDGDDDDDIFQGLGDFIKI